jgi:hypothetical protein
LFALSREISRVAALPNIACATMQNESGRTVEIFSAY